VSAVIFALALAAAQPIPESYHARGTGSSWSLTIGDGRLLFEPADGPAIDVPAPPPRTDDGYREYRTGRLAVTILPGDACSDGLIDRRADTVWIQVGEREFQGCGGAVLAADDLTDTSWHFAEIAGEAVPLTGDLFRDDIYAIDFHAQGFVGYGGCNRFSAAYSRSGDTLTAHAPWGSGARRCAEAIMAREQRLMQILTAPVRISLPDPNTLVLIGERGTIRLRRTPDQ